MLVKYFHPPKDSDGEYMAHANIIWADRDRGSGYYSVSRFAMRNGRFPASHPCAPFDDADPGNSQMGGSKRLAAFRARGYWASCFPEGDGITLKWWSDVPNPTEKTAEDVTRDIRECFGWEVQAGRCA